MARKDHETYARLVEALREVLGADLDGTTAVGAALGEQPQTANNWRIRGVPRAQAVEAIEQAWRQTSIPER